MYDTNLLPGANRTQVMAAVTNLFYIVNFMHDWYYDAGFDEVSGNAQKDNYGRGGAANDWPSTGASSSVIRQTSSFV